MSDPILILLSVATVVSVLVAAHWRVEYEYVRLLWRTERAMRIVRDRELADERRRPRGGVYR